MALSVAPPSSNIKERVATLTVRLPERIHAAMVVTVRYRYEISSCKVSNIKVRLEEEGGGLRGIAHDADFDTRVWLDHGYLINFIIDFRYIIGPGAAVLGGIEIPLLTKVRLLTIRGTVRASESARYDDMQGRIYPRGY